MTEENTNLQNWDFTTYDRQLNNLLTMCRMLLDGWNDYTTTELDCDLRSLRTKAAKACYLAEQDMAMQMNDVTRLRNCRNEQYYVEFTSLVYQDFVPFLRQIITGIQRKEKLEGRDMPTYTISMSKLWPQLSSQIQGNNKEDELMSAEQLGVYDQIESASSTIIDSVKLSQPVRLWHLMQIFMLLCNLLFHFKKMMEISRQKLTPEEKQRRLQAYIKQIAMTEYGKGELENYFNTLVYSNDGKPLDAEQLRKARMEIHNEVSKAYHKAFVSHIQDLQLLADDIYYIESTEEDYIDFTLAIAKWQLLTKEIDRQEKGVQEEPQLYNAVFHTMRHNKPIDQRHIRTAIEKALPLIERKNQWICLWCVLNHFGIIEDTSMEQFAKQMMSPQWFGGKIPEEKFVKGDTLRDYNGYFTMYDYTQWDKTSYLAYKEKHNKKKWSETLWTKFQQRCYQIEDVMREELTYL